METQTLKKYPLCRAKINGENEQAGILLKIKVNALYVLSDSFKEKKMSSCRRRAHQGIHDDEFLTSNHS